MGSGKSTAGKRLAALLHRDFVDLDEVVTEQQGMTIKSVFATLGEEYFRKAEGEALRTVSSMTGKVVACGGGTPCNEENMSVMKQSGLVVYLKMPPKALADRLKNAVTTRPLLEGTRENDLVNKITQMLEQREPWYVQADIITGGLSPDLNNLANEIKMKIRIREHR